MTPRSLSGLDERDMRDLMAGTERFAERLRGARILLTGATGWFGTWLLETLVALDGVHGLGLRIVATSRDPEAFARRFPDLHAAAPVEWVARDVRLSLLDIAGPFTHVIHAATEASAKLNTEQPDAMFNTIVGGTTQVLRLAARSPGAKVLLLSSGAVYGVQPADVERLREDHRGAPDVLDVANVYAEGKRSAELLAAVFRAKHGVSTSIARCFAFVGPHMPFDAHFAVGNFIRDAAEGEAIRIGGDGTPKRSYLYMTDLVTWLLAILLEGEALRPYNVGAEDAVSIASLAEACAAAADRDVEVVVEGRTGAGRDYVPDTARARDELGLKATVSLADALARTLAWKQRNATAALACA